MIINASRTSRFELDQGVQEPSFEVEFIITREIIWVNTGHQKHLKMNQLKQQQRVDVASTSAVCTQATAPCLAQLQILMMESS